MSREGLAALVVRHGLLCAVVVDSGGHVSEPVGTVEQGDLATLLSGLVGPYGDARNTFASLESQVLPRMWGQGEAFAFLSRPRPDTMVITLGCGKRGPKEQYELSKLVDAEVLELFG